MCDRAMPMLDADPRIASLVGLHISFGLTGNGLELAPPVRDLVRGQLPASVVEGRAPQRLGEVALGPATLDDLGKEVGDQLRLTGERGSANYRSWARSCSPSATVASTTEPRCRWGRRAHPRRRP
jgi:hypothetical protein